MSSKNYIVDNSIVGMILLSLSRSKIKFKNQDKEKTEFSYFSDNSGPALAAPTVMGFARKKAA